MPSDQDTPFIEPRASENQAIIDFAEANLKPEYREIEEEATGKKANIMVLPNGHTVQTLKKVFDEYRTAPERREGQARLESLESFIDHTNRFKDDGSAIFAHVPTAEQARLISVLDYHPAGAESLPRFGNHRGLYDFPVSTEWQTWQKVDKKPMEQGDFAAFLEDHIGDVIDPPRDGDDSDPLRGLKERLSGRFAGPGKMMEISKGLDIKSSDRVRNIVRLDTGEIDATFTSEHQDANGEKLIVPNLFVIAIPVFQHGTMYRLAVRLRYRKQGGGLLWSFNLWRADLAFQDAITEALTTVGEKTGLPVYRGRPEDK